MTIDIKSAPLDVRAAGPGDGLAEGRFVAYASVFGHMDSYGDIVDRGAFTNTLAKSAEKGNVIPVLWGHDMYDPFANIGAVLEAEEDDYGLKVTGQLDLDNPTAMQVYRLIKGRRTNTMSFAYTLVRADQEADGFHIHELELHEVSIVQVPANELAEILAVKSATRALTGRTLPEGSATSLREARDAIDSVLTSLGESAAKSIPMDGNVQEKASGQAEANVTVHAEEPSGANANTATEEPAPDPSVNIWAAKYAAIALCGEEGA